MNYIDEIKYQLTEKLNHLSSIGLEGLTLEEPKLEAVKISSEPERKEKVFTSISEVLKAASICKDCALGELDDCRVPLNLEIKSSTAKVFVIVDSMSFTNSEEQEQLGKIIAGGLKLDIKKDVYVASNLKCSPFESNSVSDESYIECFKYLQAELNILKPQVVMVFGEEPSKYFIDYNKNLASLRGLVHNVLGFKAVSTYSLKELLKDPELKKGTWQDLQLILKHIN